MARYSVRDPDSGRLVQKCLYGRTEAEARAKLVQALADRARGVLTLRRGKAPTLGQYAASWLATREVRPKTLLRYRELLELHVVPVLGWMPVERIQPQHVESLLRAKREAGASARTCAHIRDTLRAVLNSALREGLVQRNAAALARPPRLRETKASRALTPNEVEHLLSVAREHPSGPLWVVALATGARLSELAGLYWEDIDWQAGTMRIHRTLQRVPRRQREQLGEWVWLPTKTRRSQRTVPLPKIALEFLQIQRERAEELRAKGANRDPEEYGQLVFSHNGRPIDPVHQARALQRALGLPIRFHDLRHSSATFLALQGVPPAMAMAVLGHANASTTLEIYTHVAPELAREAAEAMDRALTAGLGRPPEP